MVGISSGVRNLLNGTAIAVPVLIYDVRMKLITALSLLVLAGASTAAAQQRAPAAAPANADDPAKKPTPKLSDGHPDLNGYWAAGRGPDTPVNSEFGQRSPFIKRGDWRNAKEAYADPNQPPYKPELNAKVEELAKNESKMDTAFFCKPGGVPRIGPPHAIVQAPGMPIVFLYQLGAGNAFRQIPARHTARRDGHRPRRSLQRRLDRSLGRRHARRRNSGLQQ